jgi:hypothetical protein
MVNKFALILSLLFIANTIQSQSCFDRKDKPEFKDVQDFEIYGATFIGCQMPKFNTSFTDGTPVSRDSLYGKVVVIYFWSLHQDLNTNEVPFLNKLVDSLKGQKVEFIAVCQDDPSKWDKRSETFFHFKHIAQSKPLIDRFKARPVIVIFDKTGKTVFYNCGLTQYEKELRQRSARYLKVIKDHL